MNNKFIYLGVNPHENRHCGYYNIDYFLKVGDLTKNGTSAEFNVIVHDGTSDSWQVIVKGPINEVVEQYDKLLKKIGIPHE